MEAKPKLRHPNYSRNISLQDDVKFDHQYYRDANKTTTMTTWCSHNYRSQLLYRSDQIHDHILRQKLGMSFSSTALKLAVLTAN